MKKPRAKKARKLRKRFAASAPAVLAFADPEDVHRMRVAGRTLLAYMDFATDKKGRKQPELRAAKKTVKGYMQLLGELRDLDVLIEFLRGRMATCGPDEIAFLARWARDSEEERAGARERAASLLPAIGGRRFDRALAAWEGRLERAGGPDPGRRLGKLRADADAALAAIARPPGRAVEDEGFMDQVHAARIRVKRLRYALSASGAGDEAEIGHLKALQDGLGRAQDLRVWLSRLDQYREPFPRAAGAMAAWLKAEMTAAIAAALSDAGRPGL